GGAYSEASVGIKIDEGGIIKVNREEFKISAIAPLIFGVGAILPLRNRNFTASYNKGSFSVITTPSIWVQASGGAGVLAFSHAMSMVSRINSLNINLH
ncbi:MAG: hypothetical protein ABIN97_09340, partial [Ginsengibacter sp.]